ncbi:MAG: hypothetical protein LC792_00180 [Actinobacteria bacterium]|nr:hypothetical protein [Actinomycetota bacterium]
MRVGATTNMWGMLADFSSLDGIDGTSFVVMGGSVLAVIALGCGWPGLQAARAFRGATATWSRVGHGFGAVALLVVTVLSGYGAGWAFWTAHRGDYRPYASARKEARPGCVVAAELAGLRGKEKGASVDQCVERTIAD